MWCNKFWFLLIRKYTFRDLSSTGFYLNFWKKWVFCWKSLLCVKICIFCKKILKIFFLYFKTTISTKFYLNICRFRNFNKVLSANYMIEPCCFIFRYTFSDFFPNATKFYLQIERDFECFAFKFVSFYCIWDVSFVLTSFANSKWKDNKDILL